VNSVRPGTWPRDLYTGPGGGLYAGACDEPFRINWPPIPDLIQHLRQVGMNDVAEVIANAWRV